MRLAARLRPDQMGSLSAPTGPLATIGKRGPTSKGKEEKKGGREWKKSVREGKGSGRVEERGWERRGKERGFPIASSSFNFCLTGVLPEVDGSGAVLWGWR